MRIKYLLIIDDEKYLCSTIKEMSEITKLTISSLYRIITGITKYKNKKSRELKNIKIFHVSPDDSLTLALNPEYLVDFISKLHI